MNFGSCLRDAFRPWLTLPLILVVLVITSFAWCQSDDPVHVVPRKRVDQSAAKADAVSIKGEPKLDAHMKPLRAGVDLVLVPVTVTDALNRPVTELAKRDFAVYEDNKPQQIQVFSKEDAPLSVGMILDFSKSMTNKFEMERAAVAEFFKNANPQDDYFAIAFSDRPKLIADSTQSIGDLQSKLTLAVPAGNTALLDAIYLGVAKLRSARYQRRALLIISDGGDNHSHYNPKETKRLAQEADVLMYSIGIFDNMPVPVFKTIEEKLGKRLLTEITELTGGRTITADNRDKVPGIAAAISRELREQYVLAYRSTHAEHDGKWRKIKVQVTASTEVPPLRAHYKTGYIAPEK
jgi:Ca-activated chloride channel family protein